MQSFPLWSPLTSSPFWFLPPLKEPVSNSDPPFIKTLSKFHFRETTILLEEFFQRCESLLWLILLRRAAHFFCSRMSSILRFTTNFMYWQLLGKGRKNYTWIVYISREIHAKFRGRKCRCALIYLQRGHLFTALKPELQTPVDCWKRSPHHRRSAVSPGASNSLSVSQVSFAIKWG